MLAFLITVVHCIPVDLLTVLLSQSFCPHCLISCCSILSKLGLVFREDTNEVLVTQDKYKVYT